MAGMNIMAGTGSDNTYENGFICHLYFRTHVKGNKLCRISCFSERYFNLFSLGMRCS